MGATTQDVSELDEVADPVDPIAPAPNPPSNVVTLQDRWIESISVFLLAIASVTAAWCGYQATLWAGVQAASYAEASLIRIESAHASEQALQLTQVDIAVFLQWIEASQQDDQALADFYESRFSTELSPAFDAWILTDPFENPDAPNSPIAMVEYVQPAMEESRRLETEASELFNIGQSANNMSGDYVLTTLFLATSLFFLAIATRLKWIWAQLGLTGIATVALVAAMLYITTLSVTN
ncbi:MAG TPA: hypothetical protein VEW66_07915 [Thermomicrobiales bacterium]|nr:hypothetical protein [Thermomicrobiales bacterium]